MTNLTIDDATYPYFRYEKTIEALDLPRWLSSQPIYPKFYFKDRDMQEEKAALGQILCFDSIPHTFHSKEAVHLYGGSAFTSESKEPSVWNKFKRCFFFLPRFEIVQSQKETKLIAHRLTNAEADPFESLSFPPDEEKGEELFSLLSRTDLPSQETWCDKVRFALSKIETKDLQKVVLARQTSLFFDKEVSPYLILQKLLHKGAKTSVFCFEPRPSCAFVGSTPEKLYSREKREFRSDALAGTFPRGKTETEDAHLQEKLLKSEKENKEFDYVRSFLIKTLAPCCTTFGIENAKEVLKTPKVQHLYAECKGTLLPSLSDFDLLQLLHPTPAIGGTPTDKALEHIVAEEGFDRGWYASPIGWCSPTKASFAVAIRSALIEQKRMHLYAGTGIVEGSDPLREWDELEQKISQFLDLL